MPSLELQERRWEGDSCVLCGEPLPDDAPYGAKFCGPPIETKLGISEATIAQTILIGEDGTATDLGPRPVFWQVVRRQLAKANPETPWIAGRLVQSGPVRSTSTRWA